MNHSLEIQILLADIRAFGPFSAEEVEALRDYYFRQATTTPKRNSEYVLDALSEVRDELLLGEITAQEIRDLLKKGEEA